MSFSRRTLALFINTTVGSSRHCLSLTPLCGRVFVGCRHTPASSRLVFRLASASSFQAPEPPVSKIPSVFPHIDLGISEASESAKRRNSDPDAVFVVNGSSRGIGLQMVKSLLERTQGTILACCRNPNDATSSLRLYLQSLDDHNRQRVDTCELDLNNQSTIEALAEHVKKIHNGRVDGLWNVAGVLGDGQTTPGPERSLAKVERGWLEHNLQVNVVGHVMLVKALQRPLKSNISKQKRPTSVVVNLSARVGSIADNELGGWYSYRISKAALNQATRTLSHELKRHGTHVIAVHPGTTDTDLSKPFQKNVKPEKLFPVDFTVNQILDVVDRVEDEHSGGLYDWAGKAIPF